MKYANCKKERVIKQEYRNKKILYIYSFFILLLLSSTQSYSIGKIKISGRVTDTESHEPLVQATIRIKESTTGTYSGLDGSFLLIVPPGKKATLIVSCISYQQVEKEIDLTGTGDEVDVEIKLKPASYKVSEIEVVGNVVKSSEAASMRTERLAVNTLNSVSAAAIQTSPDLTVANVIQRVSGVSVERNSSGDGQYAIVRGMDKRYNYTLIDGIKVPSPDDKNRYVPLDIFPTDLLERLDVIKVPTPSMDGDAIGGAVNMIMKNAPDEFYLHASAASGYSYVNFSRKFKGVETSSIAPLSPQQKYGNDYKAAPGDFPYQNANPVIRNFVPNIQLSFSLGNRFLPGKELGIIAIGSFQNNYRGSKSTFFSSDVDRETNAPSLQSVEAREYYAQQQRTGIHIKSDYEFNSINKFTVSFTYARLILNESRTTSDTNLVLGRNGPGTGRIGESVRTRHEDQKINNFALRGAHSFLQDSWFEWTYSYSAAEKTEPDRSQISSTTGISKDINGNLVHDPHYLSLDSYRRWSSNSDKDNSAKADLYYVIKTGEVELEPRGGVLYRKKNRENYFDNYTLRPDPNPQIYDGDASKNTFSVFNPFGTTQDALNYNSSEIVWAYYGQITFRTENLIATGGLRNEKTDFSWTSNAPEQIVGKTGSVSYASLLPSVTLKYMPDENKNLRLSYYKSLSRPGFFEVIPYLLANEDYTEKGNPYLKYVQSDNFDFRFEYFPASSEQILAGLFYKKIKNPIEYSLQESGTNLYLVPENLGTATNYGFEFDITKYFNKIGIKANYTYTNSKITTPKEVRFRDSNGNLSQRIEQQTRPLQGQSSHIANLSLLYKDFDAGITGQLSLSYTGKRIVSVSYFKDNDYWQAGSLQTDISFEKVLFANINLFLKINNLFDTPYIVEIPQSYKPSGETFPLQKNGENVIVRKDFYGQTFLAGFRYNL